MGNQQSDAVNRLGDHLVNTVDDKDYKEDKAKQKQVLKGIFDLLDNNKNGSVDGGEIKNLFDLITESYELAAVNIIPSGSHT